MVFLREWHFRIILAVSFVICAYLSRNNPHSLLLLIPTFLTFLLARFVYLQRKHDWLNISFALFSVAIALYTLAVFGLYIAPDAVFADRWARVFNVGCIFASAIGIHFVVYLTRTNLRKVRIPLYASYGLALVFYIASLSGHLEKGWSKTAWKYAPCPNAFYDIFLICVVIEALFGLALVFRAYSRATTRKERSQYRAFFVALSVLPVLAFTNAMLSFGRVFYPLSGIGALAFTSIIAYAILKYQVLDIQVIIRRSLVYASLTLAIAGIYSLLVGAITGIMGSINFAEYGWFINGCAGAIIAAGFLPLRNRIQYVVDRLFFREKYNYRQTLKDFSRDLTSIFALDVLSELLVAKITETMHIDRGCVVVLDDEKEHFEVVFHKGMDDSSLRRWWRENAGGMVQWCEKNDRVFLTEEHPELGEELRRQGIALAVPMIIRDHVAGMLCLGGKMSEELYTDEDIELLVTIAHQAAISIENAGLSEKMRALEKNIYHTDKMTALGTFASSVAHEIKNPLASIKTFCQLVVRKFDDRRFVEKFNGIVPSEIERLEGVLGQLLDFGRLSGDDFAPLKVGKAIDDLMGLVHYEAFKGNIRIVRKYGTDVPPVIASEKQLKQVFMNLIINAMQAMPNGGEIIITTGSLLKDAGGGVVYVSIADTGCGIPQESLERLFKPFYTTKANGTGLGLSITRKIIREHGGTIEVSSELNKGTVFTIKIPFSNPLQS